MRDLSAETRILTKTAKGPIVLVTILGDVRYVNWEDIGVHGLLKATRDFLRPCCIVSSGNKREDLEKLLTVSGLPDHFGGRVFEDTEAALDLIVGQVSKPFE